MEHTSKSRTISNIDLCIVMIIVTEIVITIIVLM